jgi:IS30 family transposase
LARNVAAKLRMFWSPEQIAGWLKHIYSRAESLQLGDYAGVAQKWSKAICAG